ncbi:MAG: HAD-IA family hydrolase, partial [Cyanobacteria bacterium P01_H01_bin.130]
ITPAEFLRQRRSLINTWKPRAEPMPGARELSEHLHRQGIGQAIATSSTQGPFDQKSAHHPEWFALFDVIVLRDDPEVKASKPAPDSFLVAAQRLGAKPENCLVFEDSIAGVNAALSAGMAVVAVLGPHASIEDYCEASLVLRSLVDFDPIPWNLPDFPKARSLAPTVIEASEVSPVELTAS